VVLDGDPAPLDKKGRAPPQFSPRFYCGQTAGCTKIPLGMELGLTSGDFVLDGDTGPSQIFGPCLLCPNGWMHHDATWYGGRPQPRGLCVWWGPSHPAPKRGGAPSLIFGPCLLWPNGWMDQDDTWHGGGPWSRPHCARWGTRSPLPKRGQSP